MTAAQARPPSDGPSAGLLQDVRITETPRRRFAVRRHDGPIETLEETRRPLYQHLITHELVGGPPVLRFRPDDAGRDAKDSAPDVEDAAPGDATGGASRLPERIDVLVGTTSGFDGDDVVQVEVLPAGWSAVAEFEGAPDDLARARQELRDWAAANGHDAPGTVLQVHLMDAIEGVTEQQLELPLA